MKITHRFNNTLLTLAAITGEQYAIKTRDLKWIFWLAENGYGTVEKLDTGEILFKMNDEKIPEFLKEAYEL